MGTRQSLLGIRKPPHPVSNTHDRARLRFIHLTNFSYINILSLPHSFHRPSPHRALTQNVLPNHIGPLGGSPFPGGTPSVGKPFFDKVCPVSERTILRSSDLSDHLQGASALTVAEAWAERIRGIEGRCVEVDIEGFQIFNFL